MENEKSVTDGESDVNKEITKNRRANILQFIRFGMVGILNMAVYYGIYYLLLQLGVNFILSATAGTVIGTVNSYIWNKLFVFKTSRKVNAGEIIKFCVVYAIQYLCILTVIFILITCIELSEELAGLASAAICAVVSYAGLRFWGFRESAGKTPDN